MEAKRKNQHPAKVYLKAYQAIKKQIESLEDELQYIREKATRATGRVTAERVSGTSMKDGMANAVLKGIETEERLRHMIENLKEAAAVRIMIIEQMRVDNEYERTILIDLYINARGWANVIQQMPYERSKLFKLHGQALEHFWEEYQKMIPKKNRSV